jgi:aminoglycoside phosphotransferase
VDGCLVMILADDLKSDVHDFFLTRGQAFGLDADTLDVAYVLNWGGFVNYSFRVRDARTALHLKLAVTTAAKTALRRWRDLDRFLHRYRAPAVLDWIEIGEASGLLFPAVAGSTPRLNEEVMGAVLDRLQRLWQDIELASRLRRDSGLTAAGFYLGTYHDRFTEDLRSIEANRPPFVTMGDVDFMREEAARLAARVASQPAFQEELASPIHGDLWLNNILWEDGASWHILDWDELQIGDPAMDLAMLTGPSSLDLAPLKRVDELRGVVPAGVMERLRVLGQAALLDWVIDPLADWIDAGLAPGLEEAVRKEKQRVHATALELYHSLYARG